MGEQNQRWEKDCFLTAGDPPPPKKSNAIELDEAIVVNSSADTTFLFE